MYSWAPWRRVGWLLSIGPTPSSPPGTRVLATTFSQPPKRTPSLEFPSQSGQVSGRDNGPCCTAYGSRQSWVESRPLLVVKVSAISLKFRQATRNYLLAGLWALFISLDPSKRHKGRCGAVLGWSVLFLLHWKQQKKTSRVTWRRARRQSKCFVIKKKKEPHPKPQSHHCPSAAEMR